MSYPAIHVTKIGGSLLNLPDLPARWRRWRARRQTVHDVVVVGGGALVDALRAQALDRAIGNDVAHWAAVDLMAINARLLASQLADCPACAIGPALEDRLKTVGATFIDVVHFLRHVEPLQSGRTLVPNWDVTSDAIAARLAIILNAKQLNFLKSTSPPPATGQLLPEYAAAGYVDPFLPLLASELPPVKFFDFRYACPGAPS